MIIISSLSRSCSLVLLVCGFIAVGCSSQSVKELAGVWRSEDVSVDDNLVLEFVSDGTGQVFSGASIGFPLNASFQWALNGDEIRIETVADEPIVQFMEIVTQQGNRLLVEVNGSEFTLIRVDGVIPEDDLDLPSVGSGTSQP